MSDYIKSEIGHGRLVGLVMIDLQKAFDTVDHGILLDKMKAMGISDISWFNSYLSDRSQCVEVDGTRSSFEDVTCGVPQGSILGPLLFLMYINDMHRSVDCRLALYADDSALIFSHTDASVIAEKLSRDLSCCKTWLIDNKLSLHIGKTECILFGTSRKTKKVENFEITCDGSPVNRVSSVKYLGVQLDQSFNFSNHALELTKKCASRIAFLYRNSSCLDEYCRRILCNSLIQPHLDYCCSSWYESLSRQLKDKLDVIKRRMVKLVYSKSHFYHVSTVDLKSLSWMSISDRVKFFKLVHVFKIRLGKAPDYLSVDFKPIAQTHAHNTRHSSLNYFISKELANSPKSFSFSAIKHWNCLPESLKSIESLTCFKKRLKEHIFSAY